MENTINFKMQFYAYNPSKLSNYHIILEGNGEQKEFPLSSVNGNTFSLHENKSIKIKHLPTLKTSTIEGVSEGNVLEVHLFAQKVITQIRGEMSIESQLIGNLEACSLPNPRDTIDEDAYHGYDELCGLIQSGQNNLQHSFIKFDAKKRARSFYERLLSRYPTLPAYKDIARFVQCSNVFFEPSLEVSNPPPHDDRSNMHFVVRARWNERPDLQELASTTISSDTSVSVKCHLTGPKDSPQATLKIYPKLPTYCLNVKHQHTLAFKIGDKELLRATIPDTEVIDFPESDTTLTTNTNVDVYEVTDEGLQLLATLKAASQISLNVPRLICEEEADGKLKVWQP